ncbi:TVP38/TMEM64 family protein [Streptomyces carpaticus]|uniref:TVP38/TMEM64 family membrane protein n=1 Tax=Streptomyces carpaticus TaxID=285558 RepID=A0ABV4ZI51_9ACTN
MVSRWGRLALLVVLMVAAAWAVTAVGPDALGQADGLAGPAFVVFYAVGTMAFVPKPALSVAAGVVFGLGYGLLLTVSGTVLGALLGFCAGRFLGRAALRPLLGFSVLASLERRLSERAFTSVLMLRLLPVMPFGAVNLGAAFSRMGWLPFAGATALGTLPGNVAWVLAGVSASSPATFWLWLPAASLAVLMCGMVVWRRAGRPRLRAGGSGAGAAG